MRLNTRFIKHAPKRGPDELKIELKKLKAIKIKRAINYISKTVTDVINGIKNVFIQIFEAVYSVFTQVANVVNNYAKHKKEDRELFNTLPSVRRFEHNMI